MRTGKTDEQGRLGALWHTILANPVRTFFGFRATGAMVNHIQVSREPLEIGNRKLETTIVKSARLEEAPVLNLHTAGAANRAHLEQDGTGRLTLYFRGLHYGVDDYLPNSLFGNRSIPSITAGEFVCRQMLRDHGSREDEWPALARQFLTMHTACQPNRSRQIR